MDSAYLFCYSLGNYYSGILGDSYPITTVVSLGMVLSSLGYLAMAILGFTEVKMVGIFVGLWGLQGITQSSVWPGTVSIMGNWFSKQNRGKIMGFWSSCPSVGNLVGAQLAGLTVSVLGFSWEYLVLTNLIFLLLAAFVFATFAYDKPSQVPGVQGLLENTHSSKKGISFWKAWLLPGVLLYALNYSCVKLLNYGMMMWLPYYLEKQVNLSGELVSVVANLYDLGGLLGAFLCGWISDIVKCRTPVVSIMLIVALPLYFVFQLGTEQTYWMYFFLVPLQGFFVSGAANLISCAIAADLAQNEKVKEEAMCTVTGIIDGTGSLGAGLGQLAIGALAGVGWMYVFWFMILVGLTSVVLLLPLFIREVRLIRSRKNLTEELDLFDI